MDSSVILLSIDALRADHVGYHGYERDTTPFLDEFSERSLRFLNASVTSSHTRESIPSLLTGRYPDTFAEAGFRLTEPSIAARLSEAGYRTAGFHSNPYASRAYDFGSGFDKFDDDLTFGQHKLVALAQRALNKFVFNKGEYHARAADINDKSLAWLDSLEDEPFFLWNHYMDVHGPYNPPDSYNNFTDKTVTSTEAQDLYQKCAKRPSELTNEEKQLLVDLYDGEIRYLDAQLQNFVTELQHRDLLERSLVIITADHGEAFGEHGYYAHPRYLHDELIRVPLTISLPGEGAETISTMVSTVDLVPTILDWAGLSNASLPGTSLISAEVQSERETYTFAGAQGEDENQGVRRFAVRSTDGKYLLERDVQTGEITAETGFDLESDPEEQYPLDEPASQLRELRRELIDHSATRLTAVTSNDEDETTEEIEERLEALGYK